MKISNEFKVGFFVLVCIIIIAVMSLKVNNDPSATGKAQKFDVLLPNASGIVKNSNVKMAGIPIGVIQDLVLENGKARVIMKIQSGIRFTKSATIEVKANGILGDKYLEVFPGNPGDDELAQGDRITNVIDKGSFDAVLNQVGQIAQDTSNIVSNLKKATTGDGDEESPVGRILLNVEDATADLKDLIESKKGSVAEIVDHVHSISASLDEYVNDTSEDGFRTNWKKMAKSLGRVDSILKNVDEITAKVNNGQGTIGKLINDETTVQEINHAVSGINNMLDTAGKMQFSIDYHGELMASNMIKNYIGLQIQPGPDRYYLLQIVDDPKGQLDRVNTQQAVNGGSPSTTQTQTVYRNKFKFSAQFAKNFYDLTLRAGVFESSGGIGSDYYFFRRKLRLSAEAFNFGREEGVQMRLFARLKFYSVFYAVAGGDDILNTKGNTLTGTGASGFFGAGLDFTNDDLKLLLAKVPF